MCILIQIFEVFLSSKLRHFINFSSTTFVLAVQDYRNPLVPFAQPLQVHDNVMSVTFAFLSSTALHQEKVIINSSVDISINGVPKRLESVLSIYFMHFMICTGFNVLKKAISWSSNFLNIALVYYWVF